MRRSVFAGWSAMVLAIAACGGAGEDDGAGRLRVVATTGMIADVTRTVGGEHVDVVGLMGPGVDPHLYKARESDVRRLAEADVILYHGLHLEARMADVLERMSGRVRTVAVAGGVASSKLLTPPEFSGAPDPHVWFDVRLWMEAVEAIRDALAEADPANAEAYRSNAASYLSELDALDSWVRDRIGALPPERRVLVTAHDAFNYFGRAYGIEVRGLQGINTASEAGTADVQRLADFIVERGIPAIFVESSISPRTLEAVRAAVMARGHTVSIGGTLYSDALGGPGSGAETYVGMVRHNVETIVRALGGDS